MDGPPVLTAIPDDYLIINYDLFVFFVVANVACMKASANSFEERAIVDLISCSSVKVGLITRAVDFYPAVRAWVCTFDCLLSEWTDLFRSFDLFVF